MLQAESSAFVPDNPKFPPYVPTCKNSWELCRPWVSNAAQQHGECFGTRLI